MSKDEKAVDKANKKNNKYERFSNVNKTRIVTVLAYILIIAVICLSSALQMMFDLEHFDWIKFVTNLCFSLSIAVLAMLLAVKDGEITNESKKRGDYYDVKLRFNESLKKIVDRDVFRQFCDLLYNRERKSYVDSNLAAVNIFQDEYMQVNDKDFETLRTEPKRCVVGHDKEGKEIIKPLDSISDVQYYALKKYRKGEFKYPKLEYTFFTSRNSSNGYKYQANLQQKQRNVKLLSILYRCVYISIMSAIFALAVVNPNDSDTNQIMFDTASRLCTLVSSMFFGYMLAHDEMKENMDAMQYKIDIIEQYALEKETGSFKPLNIDEQVERKIAEKEEQRRLQELERQRIEQEAKDNIVTPSVVPPQKEVLEIEMSEEQYAEFIKNQNH